MNRCILGEINEKTYILAKSPKVHKGGGSTPPPIGGYTEDYVVAIPSAESYVQISSQRSIVLSEESFGVVDDGYISNSDQQNVEPG